MTETKEQKIIVKWFRETYPEYVHCLRVSLAGFNFGSGLRAAKMVNHMRSLGVEDGESDILIALRRGEFGSLVIEHKAEGSMHTTSDAQLVYIKKHNETRNCAVVTRGVEAAKAAITQYMGLLNGEVG